MADDTINTPAPEPGDSSDEIPYDDAQQSSAAANAEQAQTGRPQWSELPANIGPSALHTAGALIFPVTHPSQFVHGIYNIATDKDTRAAVGQFYKDRYGSMDNLRDTVIRDPVGTAADLASVFTGGEYALGKLAGKAGTVAKLSPFASAAEKAAAAAAPAYDTTTAAGKAAQILGKAGSWLDPSAWAGRAIDATTDVAGATYNRLTGLLNQAGPEVVSDAAKAGREGATLFIDNIQGKVPVESIVDEMKAGVQRAKDMMHAEYQKNFPRIEDPIDTAPIHKAWENVTDRPAWDSPTTAHVGDPVTGTQTAEGLFKGSQSVADQMQAVKDMVDKYTGKPVSVWKEDPAQKPFQLADGSMFQPGKWVDVSQPVPKSIYTLDALKQGLEDLHGETANPKVQRVIQQVKEGIKTAIEPVAPGYSDAMDSYSQAARLLQDAKQTFGVGTNAGTNTKLTKLGKIYSTTAAGQRSSELLDQIENVTGQNYRASLAGQRLQSLLPGEGKLIPMLAEGYGLKEALGAVGTNLLSMKGMVLGGLASPKLSGYMTYGANRLAGITGHTWEKAGMPSPTVLGRYSIQASRPTELATDPDEVAMYRAEQAAGIK